MALDGSSHFPGSHDWAAQKPRTIEHGFEQKEAVEEDMVVLLYARSFGGFGHAEAHKNKGRRL